MTSSPAHALSGELSILSQLKRNSSAGFLHLLSKGGNVIEISMFFRISPVNYAAFLEQRLKNVCVCPVPALMVKVRQHTDSLTLKGTV
jgi:hypothetical protein